jgi:NAD(P)-dependent dehydrogenase (short-subunit alcohol dehydrogenase family)
MQLANKSAIVTGGGSGIGRAIALGLAAEGAAVLVADLDFARAEAVADEIRSSGGSAVAHPVDVSDSAAVDAMVETAVAQFGALDILVNNAGVVTRAPVVEMTDEQWDRVIAVNLRGAFLCSRAALRHMLARRSGRIVNVASGLGLRGSPGAAVYGASKAAIINLTRSLAVEVAAYGVTVNAIAPGVTDTPFWRANRTAEEIEEALRSGRVGRPEDLVPYVVLLCSDAGAALSGETIVREVFVHGVER